MPYQMLKYLATLVSPMVLTNPDDIERVELLRSAELVKADIPPTINSDDWYIRYAGVAVVHWVTALGKKLADRPGPSL